MFTTVTPIFAAFMLGGSLAFPYPFTNTSAAGNGAGIKKTLPLPSNVTVPQYHCETVYPSDLTVVNQRYPDYDSSHLHDTNSLFMLRREIGDAGEIATRVQFYGVPTNGSNTTCRLEIVLPDPKMQHIGGFNPTFNVYQVEQEAGAVATWNKYQGNTGAPLFGRVNGEPEALERTRSVGGVAAINSTKCNETMTFQMGMAYNSRDGVPNYWEFSQITLPAWPEQGFRIVYGC